MIVLCEMTYEEVIWMCRTVTNINDAGYQVERIHRKDGKLAIVLKQIVLGESNDH